MTRANYGLAHAIVCQVSYDVASLAGNLARGQGETTGTYAAECRRELAKIRDALTQIERFVGSENAS